MLFRSLLVTLIAVTPLALATPTPVANAEASTADLEDRTFFGWCSLDKTRNPYDCQCRPGLSEPNHWKKTLSLLKKECVCGDSKNSHFDHWSKSCQCSGHNQREYSQSNLPRSPLTLPRLQHPDQAMRMRLGLRGCYEQANLHHRLPTPQPQQR